MTNRDRDVEALVAEGAIEGGTPEARFAEVRAALLNLRDKVRASAGPRNSLGLDVNVALRVADAVLKRYPTPTG